MLVRMYVAVVVCAYWSVCVSDVRDWCVPMFTPVARLCLGEEPLERTGGPRGLHGCARALLAYNCVHDWWRSCMAYSPSALPMINPIGWSAELNGLTNQPCMLVGLV